MKEINDQQLINQYLKQYNFDSLFTNIPDSFVLKEYKKGEVIINPIDENHVFHFVIIGHIHIYTIHEDGNMTTLSINDELMLLGDIEYIQNTVPKYYVEAMSDVTVLCLDMDELYKEDPLFLLFISQSLSYKLIQSTTSQVDFVDVEDQLIAYIKYNCKDHILTKIEATAMNLHCSKRHLLRIIKKLVDEKKLIKLKKGTYQFVE